MATWGSAGTELGLWLQRCEEKMRAAKRGERWQVGVPGLRQPWVKTH